MMDQFYYNTKKVVYQFILLTCSVLAFWLAWFIKTTTVNGYIWLCFALISGSYIIYLSGRYVMAAINKKPALVITDEYVQIYQSGNAITFYLNCTFYWKDIQFFRKHLTGNKKNVELGFYHAISKPGKTQLTQKLLSRKRSVSFNTDIIDGHISDIMDALDKYCMLYEEKQPAA